MCSRQNGNLLSSFHQGVMKVSASVPFSLCFAYRQTVALGLQLDTYTWDQLEYIQHKLYIKALQNKAKEIEWFDDDVILENNDHLEFLMSLICKFHHYNVPDAILFVIKTYIGKSYKLFEPKWDSHLNSECKQQQSHILGYVILRINSKIQSLSNIHCQIPSMLKF